MPNSRDLLRVGRDGDEVPRDRGLVAERGERPRARRVRVRHRLERRERLRRDDEQRLVRREVAGRLDEVGRVDVRDEAEREVAPRVVAQRLVCHHRAEVGAADADVHDVADRLARVALPLARAHALGERGHPVEHLVHLARRRRRRRRRASCPRGIRSATWSTERFSVTLMRSPRNIASVRSARPDSSASCSSSAQGLVGDAVLRVVEVDAGALRREPLSARRVLGEEVAQLDVADLGVVRSSATQDGRSRSGVMGGR